MTNVIAAKAYILRYQWGTNGSYKYGDLHRYVGSVRLLGLDTHGIPTGTIGVEHCLGIGTQDEGIARSVGEVQPLRRTGINVVPDKASSLSVSSSRMRQVTGTDTLPCVGSDIAWKLNVVKKAVPRMLSTRL